MKLSKENLGHINTISHEGKVLLFGTDNEGIVWYTVKQSGFEDSVFSPADDAADGFEAWKKLPLAESTHDGSTLKKFNTLLVPVFGKDQAGKENSQAVKSAPTPVQLVSGMGHLHVFRQSSDNKLLVNRFILDGMKNELMPKLEVRFKRSRQKYEISENMKIEKDAGGNAGLTKVDALDFKDMDGHPFYEPTWKLDFIENLHQGWFSAVLLPTLENEKYRWNIFAYDSKAKKVILYTIRASHSGIFDLKDYPFLQDDPKNKEKKVLKTIHGIIKRTLDLKTDNKALIVSNGLAATAYNVQKERIGDDGEPQLLKEAARVMLAVPVKKSTDAKASIAALSFAVNSNGTLSQIDETPQTHELFAKNNELILPLNTLDEIKEFIDTTPPPSGVMTGIQKSSTGTVTVLSKNLPDTLKSGENVKISGSKNYNGLHKVVRVIEEQDGTKSFEIAATFNNSEAGFWEVVPKKQTGLTFDNMVVGYQKTGDHQLKVTCSSHKLEIGDEVQVTGTRAYDGLYPVKVVDELNSNFTIDMDYQAGEAVDLKAKKRRGIRFGGGADYLRTDTIKLDPFAIDTNGGRTLSAWVWLESKKNQVQLIVGQDDQAIELEIDSDNKLHLKVRLNDNTIHTVKDPNLLPLKTWVHYAGTVEYQTGTSKKTHLYLCKNGLKVTPTATTGETIVDKEKVIADGYLASLTADAFWFGELKTKTLPATTRTEITYTDDYSEEVIINQLRLFTANRNIFLDRDRDGIRPDSHFTQNSGVYHGRVRDGIIFGSRFTQECWIYPTDVEETNLSLLMGNDSWSVSHSPSIYIVDQTKIRFSYLSEEMDLISFTSSSVLDLVTWNHIAVTFDGINYKLYVNGIEKLSKNASDYLNSVDPTDNFPRNPADNSPRNPADNSPRNPADNFPRNPADNFPRNPADNSPRDPADSYPTPINIAINQLTIPKEGYIQEVRLWSRALTATEIQTNKNHRLTGEQNGLLAYYQFDKIIPDIEINTDTDTDYILPDQSGNNHNASNLGPSIEQGIVPLDLRQQVRLENIVTIPSRTITIPKKNAVTITRTAPTDVLTLTFWVKTVTSNNVDLVNYTSEYTQSDDIFTISSREFSVTRPDGLHVYVGEIAVDTGITVNDGEWHHLAISWESENGILVVYKNGKKVFKQSHFRKGYKLSQASSAAFILGGHMGNKQLEGSLGQVSVWSRILPTSDIQRLMEKPLTGEENYLVGAWVHGGNRAYDLTQQQKHGSLCNNPGTEKISKLSNKIRPVRLLMGGIGEDARSFTGKLSELRIWNIAHDEKTVKDSMHIPLNGREDKLAGNWRMGVIVSEKGVKQVPDFSIQSKDALVYGTPFVSERSLNRHNATNKKIVKYTNDELIAVSQRARYRESFEFKIKGPDGNAWMLDKLNNADGRNSKIFQFSYWGKISRSSNKIITFSTTLYSQDEFSSVVDVGAGWFRASCEFIVPDGVAMVRTFEIGSVKGLWGNEATPPAMEWIGMEVRKHQIEQISGAITRKSYTDDIGLAAKGNNNASGTLYDRWEDVRGLEFCEADLNRHLQNLLLRIDIVNNKDKYEKEKTAKEQKKIDLKSEIDGLKKREDWLEKGLNNYDDDHDDNYNYDNYHYYYYYYYKHNIDNAPVYNSKTNYFQKREEDKISLANRKNSLQNEWKVIDERINLLAKFLTPPLEAKADVERWKTTTVNGLLRVRNELNIQNSKFLNTLAQSQQQPQTMDQVSKDDNKLVTQGALLTFASPKSRLQAFESARGNVELNYFDTLNNLQCTVYDATADSRNTSFEQWLPSSLRSAVEFRDTADKMYFTDDKTIPMTDKWTLETWFQYPLVAKASGDVYETQVLVEDALGRQIVVKAGRYLGAQQAGGTFFETGIDLNKAVGEGWHHLAVTVEKNKGLGFYLNGKKHGSTPLKYSMVFSGSNTDDYIKWSNFENFPTTEITVSLWIKTLGRNDSPTPLCYRTSDDAYAFMLYDVNPLSFHLGGVETKTQVNLSDGFWHHLVVTWESVNGEVKIYKDGHLIDSKVGVKQGHTIPSGGTLILGQQQDSLGGGFNQREAFDGSLRGLSIWGTVRSGNDIKRDMYTIFKGNETNLVGYWSMESFEDAGKFKVKDRKVTSPQHGEIFGKLNAELVPIIDGSAYQFKTIGNATSGGKPFGRLTEMRLWCQSLSAEEISSHAQSNVLTGNEPGLVAYYPMTEAVGTSVRDHAAGTKIHAQLDGADWKACTGEMNKPASDKPKFKTLSFDGSDDYVKIPGLSGQLGGDEITIEYWFKGNKTQSAVKQLDGNHYIVAASGGTKPKYLLSNEGSENGVSAGDVQCDQWHHVAMTWKKGTTNGFVSYLDGEEVEKRNASNTSLPIINDSLYLGSNKGVSEFTQGQLAEVRIWKKACSKEQIIANMHRRLTGKETGLKACYPLDVFIEIGGVIQVRDITNNNYHGIVSGPTLVDAEDIFITGGVDKAEVLYFNGADSRIDCGAIDITNKSFSLECWVRNGNPGADNFFVLQGSNSTNKGLSIGFRKSNQLAFDFVNNRVYSPNFYTDQNWHHIVCTYDHTSRTQTLYRDGVQVGQRIATAHYSGAGNLYLGSGATFKASGAQLASPNSTTQSTSSGSTTQSTSSGSTTQSTSSSSSTQGMSSGSSMQGMSLGGSTQGMSQDGSTQGMSLGSSAETQTLSRSGIPVEQRVATMNSRTPLESDNTQFIGSLDDVRLWSRALSLEEIQSSKNQRLSGKELGLIGYWPMGDLVEGKLKDQTVEGKYDGAVGSGTRLVEAAPGLPFVTAVTDFVTASVSACEYATMGFDSEKPALKTSMLRSFRAYSSKPGDADVLSDLRIEALELKWVGNVQFKPTLLGFIEGAPPVPSENFTVDSDYNDATSVTLRESQDVSYTWNRTKETSHGLDLDLFLGAAWGVEAGIGIINTISKGQGGFKGSLKTRYVDSKSSSITSGSTLSFNDTLALRGEQERGTKFPHLGKRFVPKNVGYALVVSGMADMFVTRLARSRRMISYEIRPMEGVPLDINTITFQINPSYIMNGSLDGLTGSEATSERFFRHVPEMRNQYGGLYPASYYRLKEAYDLKEQIEQWDKDREAYFWNFDVTWRPGVDKGKIAGLSKESSYGQVSVEREVDKGRSDDNNEKSTAEKQNEKIDKLYDQIETDKDKAEAKGKKRKEEIKKRFGDPEARERASAGLDGWQSKMENLLIRAGKRNIVNTYVWDANGGLRVEAQDFANTIEHTIGSDFTIGGTLGGLVDAQIFSLKVELSALYAGELTQTSSKVENIGKTFGLDVDLSGVESKEVTNLEGKPLTPGEKVARYRFMSFYLGGNTDNFHDFFDYVVDPEWLAGNSESARALRQAKTGKPNKAWRVLHRVTYVERPSLEGVSVDTREVSDED